MQCSHCLKETSTGFKMCESCRAYYRGYYLDYRKSHPRKSVLAWTPEKWEFEFDKQGRVCKVCNRDTPGSRSGWHTDHDHKTGEFRGILCHGCNVALGAVNDSIPTLSRLIEFLKIASTTLR